MTQPLRAAAILSLAILLSRVIGLVQLIIVSSVMTPTHTDAYTAAFRITEFVNYLVAGGALSATFIPIFTQLKQARSEDEAWRFFSAIASIMSVVLLVVLSTVFLFIKPIAAFCTPYTGDKLALTVQMTRIMLPAQAFFYMGGMIVGVLNAHKRFGAAGLTGSVYNLVALGVGIAAWQAMGRNPLGFAWGILVGAFAGNFLLPLGAALVGPREERLRFRFLFEPHLPSVKQFFRNAVPIMLGVSFPVVDQIVMPYFTGHLRDGTLTQLNNGNRVMVAPLAMLAQAASVAAFPFLAGDSANQKWGSFADFIRSGLRRLMFVALPASTLLILLSQPIIIILFRHGKFTNLAAQNSSVAFAFYCVGMFAWAGQQLVARGLYALQDTVTPTIIGSVITVFVFLPLCWLAAHSSNPILNLALVTSVGASIHFGSVLIALEKKLAKPPYRIALNSKRVLGTLLRTLTACSLMGVAGLLAKVAGERFLPDNFVGALAHILLISTVAIIAFIAAAQRFRIPEWQWLRGKVLRRKRA